MENQLGYRATTSEDTNSREDLVCAVVSRSYELEALTSIYRTT
jgi:hypothetical protein